jgi:hypothetical protein
MITTPPKYYVQSVVVIEEHLSKLEPSVRRSEGVRRTAGTL